MKQITFLALDQAMFQEALQIRDEQNFEMEVAEGLLSKGVKITSELIENGCEIIITRGGTAAAITEAKLPVTIVEIPITAFDLVRALEKAKNYGKEIAIVSFPSLLHGANLLGDSLGIDLRCYQLDKETEADARVTQAFADGAKVVIGGFITILAAKKQQKPAILIESGRESIIQSCLEAKRIAAAKNSEKEKSNILRALLTYAYEGILAVDASETITFFNPFAEQLTGVKAVNALGKKINDLWPNLNLGKMIRQKNDDLSHITTINGRDVLCNKVSILVNHKAVGAVVTFQDVTQIQQMEAKVRKRLYVETHEATSHFETIIGRSPSIQQAILTAKDFAITDFSILILGETGTGKEVFAQSIHNYSSRRSEPFIAINCAALPSQILESELFGYVGGAFTGANAQGKPGLFEVAHKGTIFLDEISEMDYVTQGKLLRVLQEKKIRRVGSSNVIPIDVRIIAASNKNLWALVEQKQFRADLYYRLNVLQLHLPPLRHREKDIALLAEFFLTNQAQANQLYKHRLKLLPSALQALSAYNWPGNIRELQNVMQRIIAVHKQETVDAATIHRFLDHEETIETKSLIESNEIEQIRQALLLSKGKQGEAAKLLGISRSTLWRKIKQLQIN